MNYRRLCLWALAVLTVMICCTLRPVFAADASLAQMMQAGVINTAIEIFMQEVRAVSGNITSAATRLFWILCTIAIVLNGIRLILQEGDLQAFAAVLVRFVLIIGIFQFLLKNGGAIGSSVINSLTALTAAQDSGPVELADKVIEVNYELMQVMEDNYGYISLTKLIMAIFLIFFDFMLFGVVTSCVVLYISAYALCVLGVFVLGFGALSFTRPIAVNYLRALISVGLELMTMLVICSVGIRGLELTADFVEGAGEVSFNLFLVLTLVAMLMWSCSRVLPPLVGSLAAGFDASSRSTGVLNGFAAQLKLPAAPWRTLLNEGRR